ncbi:MAG: hypothetical protein PHN75_14470, partial [Syntrophales bacterium]|nr:hypothetical protein [Syntrophales bacterium]
MDRMTDDYTREFLYGSTELLPGKGLIRTSLLMDERMEGWIGIPHGGISMGIIMDLAMALDSYPEQDDSLFPIFADYHLGGASVHIGDVLNFKVMETDGGATGEASVDHNPQPYMSATIRYREEGKQRGDQFRSFIPERADDVMGRLSLLPFYKKCFVCGVERSQPGLRRQFHLWDGPGKIVVSPVGFDTADLNS